MAKLHNYYVLCPLIDQKSFLGVSQDRDKDKNVIVTLSKNVVNKYRLSDQKQIAGWTSKDHITSAVVYDVAQNTYVGVFNNNIIKMWKEDSDNLDKIKKYKFPINILKLIPRKLMYREPPIVVFTNGNCASLSYAVENRNTYDNKSLMKNNEEIIEASCYNLNNVFHICYIIKNNDKYEIINAPLRPELGDMDKSKLLRLKISRTDDVYVVGTLIGKNNDLDVFVLWSDSKMTMYDLEKKTWKTIGTVPWISTASSVSLSWMAKNHLILFGNKSELDGAIIVVYNIALGVGSCKYPMKLYSKGAKLYCMSARIILEASNHIGMLPYVLEERRNLSKLLGSHEIVQDTQMEIADWDTPTTLNLKIKPKVMNESLNLLKMGVTERVICSNLIKHNLEKKNVDGILKTLKSFKDVPENCLVLLLNYAIKPLNNIDVTDSKVFTQLLSNKKNAKNLKLLNPLLLSLPFSDTLLLPYLREGMSLDNALFLMSYITHILSSPDDVEWYGDSIENESKLYDWCILLMDAFYQQFLLKKDEKVTFVLDNTLKVVTNLIHNLSAVDNLLPVLNKFVCGKIGDDNEETLLYTMEIMEI